MSWDYGRLVAEVYELDKPVGSSFPGLRYYTRQLAGVTGRILEPATGTGRVLVPLLEAGFAVEGLDVSPDMLAVCRQHCQDRGLDPVLREADMTTFAEPGAYQAIIIPAGSIMLLDGRDAVPRALAAFRESLVPRRPADPGYRRARADHRAGAHAVLGTRPVPVDAAGHAHRLRPGGQPDDQLPAVREVARRRPGRHRAAAVPAAVLEPDRIRAPPGRRGIHRHQRDRRLPR